MLAAFGGGDISWSNFWKTKQSLLREFQRQPINFLRNMLKIRIKKCVYIRSQLIGTKVV